MKRKAKVQWKKIGGGNFHLLSGANIKPGQIFEAYEHEVPMAFRDVIVRVEEPKPVEVIEEVIEEEDGPAIERTKTIEDVATVYAKLNSDNAPFFIKAEANHWYNILSKDGKIITPKKLRKAPAEALLIELLS